MNIGLRRRARECALQMMFQLDVTHDRRNLVERYWEVNPAAEAVKTFSNDLVSGCIEHLSEIDPLLEKYAEHWTLSRMSRVDRNVLRIAVYELLYREDIPARVTLNEAIDIAKKYSEEASGAFINGILDKILKEVPPANKKTEDPDSVKEALP
jgi:N utilization substance protein B